MGSHFRETFDHLSRHKLRTVLTGLAVGWGVLLLVFMLGFGTSIEDGLRKSMGDFNSYDVQLLGGYTSKPFDGLGEGRPIYFDPVDTSIIKRVAPQIGDVYMTGETYNPVVESAIASATDDGNRRMVLYGVHPSMFGKSIRLKKILQGRVLTMNDYHYARHNYVIPDRVAELLFPQDDNYLGKQIVVNGVNGSVVGVYETDKYGNNTIYVSFTEYASRNSRIITQIDRLCLDLGETKITTKLLDDLEETIRGALSKRKRYDPEDPNVVSFTRWNIEGAGQMNLFFDAIQIFMWIVGLSILSVGIIGVSNIMLVTVSERRREIGIRKALGAKPRHLTRLVLEESVVITLFSGLLGMALGIVVLWGLDYGVTRLEWGTMTIFGDTLTLLGKPTISLRTGFFTVLVMTFAGIMAGYRPARRAIRIPAVEAMHEN